jgi:hypothetical protein
MMDPADGAEQFISNTKSHQNSNPKRVPDLKMRLYKTNGMI